MNRSGNFFGSSLSFRKNSKINLVDELEIVASTASAGNCFYTTPNHLLDVFIRKIEFDNVTNTLLDYFEIFHNFNLFRSVSYQFRGNSLCIDEWIPSEADYLSRIVRKTVGSP